MENKVGLILVSYNASKAVRITLASIIQAKNSVPYKLFLVDNASNELERQAIKSSFDTHVGENEVDWVYIQQDKNLGFSGGNNVGIRLSLEDPSVSHVCLLNSDVIVSDFWLDRLVDADYDIISSVTNKADSEQCVPVDYEISIDNCLQDMGERFRPEIFDVINEFSQRWNKVWNGNIVEAEPTFFCVLITRKAVRKIGLLDETFFPGGFEDDDYCLRAKKLGYKTYLARDVYIHHWGSASFGNLQLDYFSERAKKNKGYLENKHRMQWRRRPEKPLISFKMDFEFSAKYKGERTLQTTFIDYYVKQLTPQIEYFENEFKNLSGLLNASDRKSSVDQIALFEKAKSYGDLLSLWFSIDFKKIVNSNDEDSIASTVDKIQFIADGIHTRVEMNFIIHALLFGKSINATPPTASIQHLSKFSKLLWVFKKGLPNFLKMKGIVFFGGYYYPERQSDGYFQRINLIDSIFPDLWRVYVEGTELKGRTLWIDRPQKNVLVLRISGSKLRRIFVIFMSLLCVLKCRRIYFHSVLRMQDHGMGILMKFPFIKKVIDIHGVVPDEFRFHNDFYSGRIFDKHELDAVRNSDLTIVVTNAMHSYLKQKYRNELLADVTVYPMFPKIKPHTSERVYKNEKPVVVYAGGLHKWQQVPKMIAAISATIDACEHRFYCGQPDVVKAMLPSAIKDRVIVESKQHSDLMELYNDCHYGFILREDIVVNNVACPTKLVEYIALGIVPIVDSTKMGDFFEMGLKYITLDSFVEGALPKEHERLKMAQTNVEIYNKLNEIQLAGAQVINQVLRSKIDFKNKILKFLQRTGLYFGFNFVNANGIDLIKKNHYVNKTYDVLLQVDNFEAGGLENVVLDLAKSLNKLGFSVAILVLGSRGVSVERAREMNIDIFLESQTNDAYTKVLNDLKPKVILSNYSIFGAALCKKMGIQFVQIIHNTYMWFNESEKHAFEIAAQDTTAFIAVSEYARKYSISKLNISNDKFFVIPNGIDTKKFLGLNKDSIRAELRRNMNIRDDEFVFISMASVNHQKNHISTVKAFIRNYAKLENARLLIAGPIYEPGLFVEIENEIRSADAGHKINYIGVTSEPEKFYAASDAFIAASFFEGGPLNFLEALLSGLPSVMTNVGVAGYFSNFSGVTLIDPPIDLIEYNGSIANLQAGDEFVESLSKAILKVYENPIKPILSEKIVEQLDNTSAFKLYGDVIRALLQQKELQLDTFNNTWTTNLKK